MSQSPMRVQKFTPEDPELWQQVGEDQQIFVSDVIDEPSHPEAKMTVGFARVGKGERLDISFPYDEVLILTKGAYTVETEQGEKLTARAGDFIYLPARSVNVSYALEDTEMVYVANPPDVYARHVAASAGEA